MAELTLGTETQAYERQTRCTGIQRVMRVAHTELDDLLALRGMEVVPLHTRDLPRIEGFREDPFLSGDPVLQRQPRSLNDVDLALMMDLNPAINFQALRDIQRERRFPIVSMIYDILPLLHSQWFPEVARRHFRVFVQETLLVADHIVVISEKVRQDVLDLGWRTRGEIHVIPLGSHFTPLPPPQFPDDRISMLYVSTVAPHKGHELLLAAFNELLSRGEDVSLTIIGAAGWWPSPVEALRAHPEFGGRLTWIQNADDLTIRDISRTCNIAAAPSEEEGFGLWIEEGLALGLKVAASDIPVFRERAQPNVTFGPRTPEGMAETILQAHRTPWQEQSTSVRSMIDFSVDLGRLICEISDRRD